MATDGFGDFQTPPALAAQVVAALRRAYPGRSWPRVLEPTCGTGAFLAAVGVLGPRQVRGVEISHGYAESARQFGDVLVADVFSVDLGKLDWNAGGDLLSQPDRAAPCLRHRPSAGTGARKQEHGHEARDQHGRSG